MVVLATAHTIRGLGESLFAASVIKYLAADGCRKICLLSELGFRQADFLWHQFKSSAIHKHGA